MIFSEKYSRTNMIFCQLNLDAFTLGWDRGKGWKNILNNLRLILQPFVLFNFIKPWLQVFTVPKLSEGFFKLQMLVNNLTRSIFQNLNIPYCHLDSA